jgi:enterochelin esterase-like enzyme
VTGLAAVLLAASTLAGPGDPVPFAPGTLVERVSCEADPRRTYALYLPSSYEPTRAWPILYLLDPAARGRLAVEQFRSAAEERGWIVAGSA